MIHNHLSIHRCFISTFYHNCLIEAPVILQYFHTYIYAFLSNCHFDFNYVYVGTNVNKIMYKYIVHHRLYSK